MTGHRFFTRTKSGKSSSRRLASSRRSAKAEVLRCAVSAAAPALMENLEGRLLFAVTGTTPQPITSIEGNAFNGAVVDFTANDAGPFTATVNWGDGTTTPGAIVPIAGGFAVNGTHTYADDGAYTTSTTITDTADNTSVTPVGTATIGEALLSATSNGSFNAIENEPFTASLADFTDPGSTSPAGGYIASIDWGDGTPPTAATITGNAGSYAASGTHTYAASGTFNPTITFADGDDPTFTISIGATVNVAPDLTISVNGPSQPGVEGGMLVYPVTVNNTGTLAESNVTVSDLLPANSSFAFASFTQGGPFTASGSTVSGNLGTIPGGGTVTGDIVIEALEEGVLNNTVGLSAGTPPTVTTYSSQTVSTVVVDAPLIPGNSKPLKATEGSAVTGIVGTFTDANPNADPADYSATINWGDGTTSPGSIVVNGARFEVVGTHTFAEEGTNLAITTSIKDVGGSTATLHDTANVADPAVIATGGNTFTAVEGASTGTLALATFTDPGGAEAVGDYSATVNWGDGTPADAGTISISGGVFTVSDSHTYVEESGPEHPGSTPYQVTVVVHHDTAPDSNIASDSVTVSDPSVIAAPASTPVTSTEGSSTGSITLATFTDPGGAEASSDYLATISWGDGTSSSGTISVTGGTFSVSSAGHTYAEEGVYTPVITIQHESSTPVTVSDSDLVTVLDAPLKISATTFSGLEGRVITATVANFTDAYTAAPTSDFSASVNWGDGKIASGTIVKDGGGKFHVVASHAYAEEDIGGPYAVNVTVTDIGGSTASITSHANIADAPLVSAVGTNFSVKKNVAFTTHLLGSFTDEDALNMTAADYQNSSINWGDGSAVSKATFVRTGSSASVGSFWKVYGSHKYTSTGVKHVTITLHDGPSGSTVKLSLTITVTS